MRGAEDWISRSKARRSLRPPSGDMRTISLDGTNLFHLVALEGGGFVTVAADDSGPAIRGFSPSGEIPEIDDNSPLWALLVGDSVQTHGMKPGRGRDLRRKLKMERRRMTPRRLSAGPGRTMSAADDTSSTPIDGIDDLRVAPLVESKWDQGAVTNKRTYNYYVPNGYLCGCVATAMAQLMRYHEYPKAKVEAKTFKCYIGSAQTQTNLTMKAGVYDWANMPLEPDGTITDVEREAIGRLCFDAGVATRMRYGYKNGSESGAWGEFTFDPLKKVFKYANAHSYAKYDFKKDEYSTLDAETIKKTILANLDGGFPVLLGIVGSSDLGHSIVADGYGYDGGTLYCHLNMGWSGENDYWYAMPENVSPKIDKFNCIYCAVYNVFPENEGELVTGRVVGPDGKPATNAFVVAEVSCDGEEPYTTNLTVSATGVYSLIVPSADCTTKLYAAVDDKLWASTNSVVASTVASVSPPYIDFASGYYDDTGMRIGNSWGNDLYLAPVVEAGEVAFTPAAGASKPGFSLSFEGTGGAWYTVWRSELLPPDWVAFTNIQATAEGAVSAMLPMDSTTNSCFYCITPQPFTP